MQKIFDISFDIDAYLPVHPAQNSTKTSDNLDHICEILEITVFLGFGEQRTDPRTESDRPSKYECHRAGRVAAAAMDLHISRIISHNNAKYMNNLDHIM